MPYWYPLAVPTFGEEEIEAVASVMRSGRTTMGENVEAFEEAFARRVGARHAVMVNSGSSADLLIAFALRLQGEVLVPAVTWPTQMWSWKMAGNSVHLVDVDGINTTADLIADAIGSDTVAVSLTHLMGVPCDMEPIAKLCENEGLLLTEDCCEALGAYYDLMPVGTFGVAAAWSFFFSHHMSTMEGGMVTTGDAELAALLRTLRSHGWARHLEHPPEGMDPRYTFVDWGFNVRPMEVSAAVGLVQLGRLCEFNEARGTNLRVFAEVIGSHPAISLPEIPERAFASWFGIPMLLSPAVHRDGLAAYLEHHGVETRPILAGNLARQPALRRHHASRGLLHGAERVHEHGLYVGLHPTLDSGVERVAELVKGFCS